MGLFVIVGFSYHFEESAYLLLVDCLSDIEAFDLVFVAFLAYFDLDLHVPGVFVGQS